MFLRTAALTIITGLIASLAHAAPPHKLDEDCTVISVGKPIPPKCGGPTGPADANANASVTRAMVELFARLVTDPTRLVPSVTVSAPSARDDDARDED